MKLRNWTREDYDGDTPLKYVFFYSIKLSTTNFSSSGSTNTKLSDEIARTWATDSPAGFIPPSERTPPTISTARGFVFVTTSRTGEIFPVSHSYMDFGFP